MARCGLFGLFLVSFAVIVPAMHAFIAEYDDYWQSREAEAKRKVQGAYHPEPYNVTNHLNYHVHMSMKGFDFNDTRRSLAAKYQGECVATNPIDACWRCQSNWHENRFRLADCALGFGRGTTGGKGGKIYVVTDSSDNDMVNPKPGTLRHAVIQEEPLWIIFDRSMFIRLNQELIMASNKTIDGRGANVHITGGAGITIQFVENIIVHGIRIHDTVSGSGGMIRDSVNHYGLRTQSDGDAVSIFGSSRIWLDHLSLTRAADGLIDAVQGSTAITISNCHMTHHNDVFLFGASDSYTEDKKMQITVAFNHFGKGLIQRMPRCRFGFFHVVNNDYTHWLMYAIGGSMNPTIISQGNRFIAPPDVRAKEVTKREAPESVWKSWNWRSENDVFMNGAYFRESGSPVVNNPYKDQMIPPFSGSEVNLVTRFVGPLKCVPGKGC
ncbi:Probable pectate lyase P59 [Ancistrocladus abbreviatus]